MIKFRVFIAKNLENQKYIFSEVKLIINCCKPIYLKDAKVF